jgi:hypothetical protein
MANKDIKIQIKAVNKTRRAFMAVTAGLGGIAKAAFSMKTAIGLAAGALGIGFLIKRSMDATDELAKTARAIGLSVTELQRFQYAAELGGVESKALNKAMQKLAINISDVAGGTGEAKDAFERYGISAKNADGSTRSVSDVMGQAATALEGMTNKTDRASFVYDLFGARGAKVINMLQDGKAAMEAMKAEADRLGLVMSGALIQGVEDANDAILRLTSYLGNVFNRVVASLAPIITEATDALRSFVEMKINDSGGIAQFSRDIAVNIVKAARSMVQAFGAITNSIIGFSNAIGSVENTYEKLFGDKQTITQIEASIASTVEQLEMLKNMSKGNDPLIASQARQVKELEFTILTLRELIATGHVLETNPITPKVDVSGTIKTLDNLEARLSKITDSNVSGDVTTTETTLVDVTGTTGKERFAREYEFALDHDRRMTEFNQQRKAREQAERNESLSLTHQYLKKQSAIQKAAQQKDFGDVKEEGRKTLDALGGHYKAAFALNKAFAIKDALVNTYKAISTALSSAPYPLNIALAAAAALQGYAQVKAIRSTQFRANGGPMSAGSPYIVGERGPELVVPNQAANVVPNDQLNGGNFTINISANDTAGFDELLTKRRGTLMNIINQSLNERGRPALA